MIDMKLDLKSKRNTNIKTSLGNTNANFNSAAHNTELERLHGNQGHGYADEQEYAPAQNQLGECYAFGNGVEQDYQKALEWYMKAADQNDSEAQYNIGVCYFAGNGVEADWYKAVEWYKKSADNGNERAKTQLEGMLSSTSNSAVNTLGSIFKGLFP